MNISEHRRVTGFSGNEIYCLNKINMRPGQLCVGIGAGLSTLGGGEVSEITNLVHEGRTKAFNRMMQEAKHYGGVGLSGINFNIINHGGNIEFLITGSTIHSHEESAGIDLKFSTAADAQELYCQMDSGFEPLHFVFGNVAYSIGIGGNISGAFRKLVRGEVPQYSEIFDHTRHLALERICQNAKQHGANAVIGIQTTVSPLMGTQEMIMVGTASRHPLLGSLDTLEHDQFRLYAR